MKYYPLFCLFFLSVGAVNAQNIVEVLGKEKIQTTEEGTIIHQFTQGLALKGAVNPGYVFNPQDIIAWQYAVGKFHTPQAGENVEAYPVPKRETDDDLENENELKDWIWADAQADTKGIFQHLRSTYLYTSYRLDEPQKVLLEATGNTRSYVNGSLYEGDYYDYGWQLTPVKLNAGLNEFILTPGRFGRVSAKLVKPRQEIMFTKRDRIEPELLIGNTEPVWSAVRVINMTDTDLRGCSIRAVLNSGETLTYKTDDILAMSVRKVKYQLPAIKESQKAQEGKTQTKIELLDPDDKVIDTLEFDVKIVSPAKHHTRTFISNIDGSVQFFSVQPAKRSQPNETKALVLSTHGASVDARGQAGCYSSKDWIDLVAPTGRRPYGFHWEDWGRLDALEVLQNAKELYKPFPDKIYITGHSMGGHGAWYLATTYPDMFAATGPCAGYPDRVAYIRDSDDDNAGNIGNPQQETEPIHQVFQRSANAARLLKRIENLKQIGVYIFHGSVDTVVPTKIARKMRQILAEFHTDFCYEEFPDGAHWFGSKCMDWGPIFDFFKRHTIAQPKNVKNIDFYTISPSVSSHSFWLSVEQQEKPFEVTHLQAQWDAPQNTVLLTKLENAAFITVDIPALQSEKQSVEVKIASVLDKAVSDHRESTSFSVPSTQKLLLAFDGQKWTQAKALDPKQKNPQRSGGFKEAINNNVVFVYATGGTETENKLYKEKARFDADSFYYLGNGSIDVIADTQYTPDLYQDRNVLLYGNKDCNRVWDLLLSQSPIQVKRNAIRLGDQNYTGEDLGTYFVYPHPQSVKALVGVVAGTGERGIRAAYPNNYFSAVTGFPDFMIFRTEYLRNGLKGVEAAGFFDNHWSLPNE